MHPLRVAALMLAGISSLACGGDETAVSEPTGTGGADASTLDGNTDSGGNTGADAPADSLPDVFGDDVCLPPCGAEGGEDAPLDAATPEGGLVCETGQTLGTFTVTDADQSVRVKLPLTPGVVYRRLTMSFRYTPTQWSPACYNPSGSNPAGFPAFESWIALKRGAHWCKGGNLFEVTLQGPAPGHGASNQAGAETYFKNQVHTGAGCGDTDVEAKIFSQTHGVTPRADV